MTDFVFVFCCLINIKHTVDKKECILCHFKSCTDQIYCYTRTFILSCLRSFITYIYVINITFITYNTLQTEEVLREWSQSMALWHIFGCIWPFRHASWAQRWLYMCMFCSVSERMHRNPPEKQVKFSFVLLKPWINLINFNKSSMSHFAKVMLHDFTDLHVKLGFYKGAKAHRWKGGGMGEFS